MAILLDFSQVCLSATHAFAEDVQIDSEDKEYGRNILRHVILSQIKSYKEKYGLKYGKLIICCDGKHYWRKDIFPEYKACRKKIRATSTMDWKLIFNTIDEIIVDLKENFPYTVIQIDNAESDDIVATLTKYFQTNETSEHDFFTEPQPILIVSSDKDFMQLHKYHSVEQISPRNKRKIVVENPKESLHEKVIRGDSGDGIPNILSEDNVFVNGIKQESMTKAKLKKYMDTIPEKCSEPEVKRRWERNRRLIDFDYIPNDISEKIIEAYKQPIKGNKAKVFKYLLSHKCQHLLRDVDSF